MYLPPWGRLSARSGNGLFKGSPAATTTRISPLLVFEFSAMEIPNVVYRVFDDSSVSKFDPFKGFLAGDPTWPIEDWHNPEKMNLALSRHLDWYNREPTPFLSTSSCVKKTLHEAERRGSFSNVYVAKIDAKLLCDAGLRIGQARELALRYDVDDWTWVGTVEYLFLGHIPSSAVRILTRDELAKLATPVVCVRGSQLTFD